MKRKSMSKNLTRKGLAFGALVALGASVFAGTPAFAADSVVLAADYAVDKTLAAPISESLRLNASLAPGSTAANIAQLKYKIVTDGTFVAKVTGVSGATPTSSSAETYTGGLATQTTAYTAANVKTTTYFTPTTPATTTKNSLAVQVWAIPGATDGAAGSAPVLTGATATPSKSVTVTAFIDSNLNGLLDTGEASAEQTIKFLKYSEVTTSTSITAPVQGDTTATALVKFTNVNNEALADTAAANATTGSGNASDAASIGAYFTKGDGTALKTAETPVTTITGGSLSGTTLTVSGTAFAFQVGDKVTLAGLTAATGGSLAGSYTITGVTSTTDFTVTVAAGLSGAVTVSSPSATRTVVQPTGTTAWATNVLTVTAKNTFAVGDVVSLAGITATVNGTTSTSLAGSYAVVARTSTTFDVAYTATTVASISAVSGFTVTRTASNTEAVQFTPVASYSATTDGFKFTTGTVPALAKSTAIKVQPLFYSKTALTAALSAKTIGTSQTAAVATRVLGSFKANFVKSTSAADANLASTSEAEAVAINSTKSVEFIAKDTATVAKAVAGQAVTVKVETNQTLSATKTLTINGVTYTSNTSLPGYSTTVAKLAVTTGADGKAVVSYTTAGFAAAENNKTVTLTAYAENFSAAAVGTETDRNFNTAAVYISNLQGTSTSDIVANTTDGTAVPVNVVVQDQFGAAPADGTHAVTATSQSQGQVTPGLSTAGNTNVAVVGGKANLSILDGGTGLGTNTYLIKLKATAADGTLSDVRTIAGNLTINIVDAADLAAGEVTIGGSTTKSATTGIYSFTTGVAGASDGLLELTYSAFKTVDLRAIVPVAPETLKNDGLNASTNATIAGTVKSASTATYGGVVVPNASVTVSAAGLEFKTTQNGKEVWGDGSLTFLAGKDGTFSVDVFSSKAGKQLVTIKSGTGSASVYVYAKAAVVADASSVSVVVADAAAQFQAGRALDVTVKVTDSLGNPVVTTTAAGTDTGNLVLSQTGSGYLANTGIVTTDATGVYTTKLITNAGDLGTSTIKATFDVTDATASDIVKSVSSEFGVTDADVTVGGRAVYASVEFAKGKTVTVSVDGKRLYSKLFSTDAYTELKFTQKTAGKHVVTVRISGGIVYSESVTTTK
jgi:hypothetical protein